MGKIDISIIAGVLLCTSVSSFVHGEGGLAAFQFLQSTNPVASVFPTMAVDGSYAGVGSSGTVLMFQRSEVGVWTRIGSPLVPNPPSTVTNGEPGFSQAGLAVSGDIVVVGAPSWATSTSDDDGGAVFVYERNGSEWTQTALLTVTPDADDKVGFNDGFGTSVATDGTWIVVGAKHYDDRGRAFLFAKDQSGDWTLQQTIVPSVSGPCVDLSDFGHSVDIHGDRIVVLDPLLRRLSDDIDDGKDNNSGPEHPFAGIIYTYTYDRMNDEWVEEFRIEATDYPLVTKTDVVPKFTALREVAIENDTVIAHAGLSDVSDSSLHALVIFDLSVVPFGLQIIPSDIHFNDAPNGQVAIDEGRVAWGFLDGEGDSGITIYERTMGIWTPVEETPFVVCDIVGTISEIAIDWPSVLATYIDSISSTTLSFTDPFACLGDANGDMTVGIEDMNIVLAAMNSSCECDTCVGDLDGSGNVDINDINVVLATWGDC